MLVRRKSKEKREVAISLRVTKSEYASIKKTADRHRLSMPQLMERAIIEYVERAEAAQ